ncbi:MULTISPECIES: hypothetical protein [Niastella]|uniref:Beta-lactamase-inhibitor-like PepSY-like domain-containing protein n=1 Tax=Niastella soli TaxID=2821487 RepID=A0ABS3Z111_9BACT|nr:hypothetical protein [Niastella soli]MBO9203837.1 hypothetical protein [Niastella soli]
MKKIVISGLAIVLLNGITSIAPAQFVDRATSVDATSDFNSNKYATTGVANDVTNINSKAVESFTKQYANATDITWSRANNREQVVRFFMNGIQSRIFFNNKGRQTAMIRYYTEDKLPKEPKQLVKSAYYDYHIFVVVEVTVDNKTAYLVTIKNETNTKTIRVLNGEMDVIEEFKNA